MITEDQLEQLAIQWFQDTGWTYVHGAVIAPEGVAAEREVLRTLTPALCLRPSPLRSGSQGEKEEDGRLAEAVRRLNAKLLESAVEEVVHGVTKPEHPSLVQSKERRYPIALTMMDPWESGMSLLMGGPWASADGFRRSLGRMPRWGGRIGREPKA
jgi:hypothetical protein